MISSFVTRLARTVAGPSVRAVSKETASMICTTGVPFKKGKIMAVDGETNGSDLIQFEKSLSDADRRRLQEYRAEYETWKFIDDQMPEYVPVYFWQQILNIPARDQRIRFLWYIGTRQRLKEKEVREKEENRKLRKEINEKRSKELEETKHIAYGLYHNNFIYNIQRQDINERHQWRQVASERIKAPQIVFDMGFMAELSVIEYRLACFQLRECVAVNRRSKEPFRLLFTNVDTTHEYWKYLTNVMLIEFEQSYEYFIEYTSKSYLDLFPKTNLVYLSPDSKKVMDRLDLDRTYIIASIVDRHSKVSTYAKAKQEGIESQRLPITNYIKYLAGARKTLCLNHVLGILLDVQSSGDWKTALQSHIPKRFFDPEVNERPTGHKMLIKNRERLKMLTDVIVTDGN